MPSAATKSSFCFLYLKGCLKVTLANGAPRPGSWMISVTTPFRYPFLSPKSRDLNLAGPLRWWVWDLKTEPAPLLHKLSSIHALGSNKKLLLLLVPERVSESNSS
ncbi:hypothetical protein SADUNF_Sadunf07G0011600 [Salix dunnii]|uniref:Uncharacterized protein n=1 Tax=Salix dunnii TaxID=1413687 RepID=A0A835JZE2_9ROSI|nr:hypothetical protein SADUNF_Sadunf07G0011600 [Salix dunnii]